jgi:putative SbcD/Mre11-related phosphoesterase
MGVEPVPGEPAAIATTAGERALVVADYHAGIEAVLRADGIEIGSRADRRRERLLDVLAETGPDRLVVLGDLTHAIGEPWTAEREEIRALFDAVDVPVTLVKGNHDGEIEPLLAAIDHDVTVTPGDGTRLGEVGFAHGHTWPAKRVLSAAIVCVGHEHPVVRLTDEVGGGRHERAWLRGGIDPAPFEDRSADADVGDGNLVVFPAFNDLSGGTWINVDGEFLSPFLPDGLDGGEVYLLDGTRLGEYRDV